MSIKEKIENEVKRFAIERLLQFVLLLFGSGVVVGALFGYSLGVRQSKVESSSTVVVGGEGEAAVESIQSVTEESGAKVKSPTVSPDSLTIATELDAQSSSARVPVSCIDISGAVRTPGVYCLDAQSMLIEYIKKAGDFSEVASGGFIAREVNLSRVLPNSAKVYIPSKSEVVCQLLDNDPGNMPIDSVIKPTLDYITVDQIVQIPVSPDVVGANPDANDPDKPATDCVNINTATLAELETLSGVGPSTATKIIDARPFSAVEDLMNVSGIGESKYNQMKDSVCPI